MTNPAGRPVLDRWTRAVAVAALAALLASSVDAAEPTTSGPEEADRSLGAVASLAVLNDAAAAAAQDTQEAPTTEEINAVVNFFKQIEFSALVDGYYLWAGNEVGPQLHAFDINHNNFSLSYAEVAIGKPATESSRAGFRLDFGAGDTADVVNSFEPGGEDYLKYVQQAYVTYLAGDVTIDFGKFVTPHGAELIESSDNFNYSRGLLFTLAIPFYHAGLRVGVPITDTVSLTGFLVNGWNNVIDNNGDKTVGVSLGLTPTEQLGLTLNYMVGNEGTDEDGARSLIDVVGSFSVTDAVSVVGNFDFGWDEVAGENVDWYGVALGLKLQATEHWAFSPRYEFFVDDDGWATGLSQTLQEITLTAEYQPVSGFLTRFEFRSDFSDEDYFFDNRDDFTGTQPTFLVSFVYTFAK
jgi:hypothetical protein